MPDGDKEYVYTARDPHYEIICSQCRYGSHDCRGKIVLTGGVLEGTYQCACLRCMIA